MKGGEADRYSRKIFYLAMALMGRPSLMIIDGLLEFMDKNFLSILSKKLSKELTLIATSKGYIEDLEFDRILRLEKGRIFEAGVYV
jgi:ABC-type multidrug transport system ATPase subunit